MMPLMHSRSAFRLQPLSCIRHLHWWAHTPPLTERKIHPMNVRRGGANRRPGNIPTMNGCTSDR